MSDTELANILNKNPKIKPKGFGLTKTLEIGMKICLL